LSWTPEIELTDSTVYYWRISADTSEGFDIIWDESSFLYLQDQEEGWNQSHYFQHLGNYYNNMEIREDSRRFEYLEDVKFVRIQNGVFPALWPNINFNNTPMDISPGMNPPTAAFILPLLILSPQIHG
jgi:hypothetical protein